MQHQLLAVGAAVLLLLVVILGWRRRRSSATRRSKRAHDAAQSRSPPVELGGEYDIVVTEFTDHHSGERVAVGKVEGFVLFVSDVPKRVDVGDLVTVRVDSWNRNRTSADATFVAHG